MIHISVDGKQVKWESQRPLTVDALCHLAGVSSDTHNAFFTPHMARGTMMMVRGARYTPNTRTKYTTRPKETQ